jgi:hypothetical protein
VAEEIKTVASVGAPFMNSYSRKLGRNERFSWEMSIFGMAIIECRTFFVKHRAATGLVIVFIFFFLPDSVTFYGLFYDAASTYSRCSD